MLTPQKVLIVGGGSIGERHVRCWLRTGRADVFLSEPNEARGREVAERYSVTWMPDFSATLTSLRPDCVVICTPAPMHVSMALQALEAGAHVLIEKPLSVNLHGVKELSAAAAIASRTVAVAYVWRMHPALRKAKELLESGAIGRPLQALAHCGQDFATQRPAYAKTYYAHHEQGGGAIQDGLTHVANAVEMLLGPTTSLSCEADHLAIPEVEIEDAVGVVARHGEAIAVYSFNQAQKPNEFAMDVHGDAGSLRIDLSGKQLGIYRDGAWQFEATPYVDHDFLFTEQADGFLNAVEGKAQPACSLDDGARSVLFNLACLESARTGQRIIL